MPAGGRGAAPGEADTPPPMYIVNVESDQITRVLPPPTETAGRAGRGGGRGNAAGALGGGVSFAFARDGRTLYYRIGQNLYAAPINLTLAGTATASEPAAGGGRGGRGGGAAPASPDQAAAAATSQTARHVTYNANLEVDRRALRAQVFNEGWRIM